MSNFTFAQQAIVDSLKQRLKIHPAPNADRLELLNEIAYYYSFLDPEKGISMAENAISLAQQLDNDQKLATAFSRKAVNLAAHSDDSLALLFYDKAYAIRKELDQYRDLAIISYNKGLIYSKRSQYRRAIENTRIAYDAFRNDGDSLLMAKMLNSVGINHTYLSQYAEALEAYASALSIYEHLGKTEHLDYACLLYTSPSPRD